MSPTEHSAGCYRFQCPLRWMFILIVICSVASLLYVQQKRIQTLESHIADLRSKSDRNKAVTTDKEQTFPDVSGTVLEVSKARADLVVISVGSDDGVRLGMKLDVFIPGQYRGKVEVLKVLPDKSLAQVMPDYSRDQILPNDQVATRLQ